VKSIGDRRMRESKTGVVMLLLLLLLNVCGEKEMRSEKIICDDD